MRIQEKYRFPKIEYEILRYSPKMKISKFLGFEDQTNFLMSMKTGSAHLGRILSQSVYFLKIYGLWGPPLTVMAVALANFF